MTSEKPIREENKMNRREFFTKSVAGTAGLALLTFPGIIDEVLAAKGEKSKEEIVKELEEKAAKFMAMRKTCSQASFAALNEQFKLNAGNVANALMPFQGMTMDGETCGAVSGTLLALGFIFEPEDEKSKKTPGASLKPGALFFDRFKEAFGSTRCHNVQKRVYGRSYDARNPEELKLFMEAGKSGKCVGVVKKAVSIACEIILENS